MTNRTEYGFSLDRSAPRAPANPAPIPAQRAPLPFWPWLQTLSARDAFRVALGLALAFWLIVGLTVANWEQVRAVALATLHSAPIALYGWTFSGLIAWPRGQA